MPETLGISNPHNQPQLSREFIVFSQKFKNLVDMQNNYLQIEDRERMIYIGIAAMSLISPLVIESKYYCAALLLFILFTAQAYKLTCKIKIDKKHFYSENTDILATSANYFKLEAPQ